MISGVYGFAFLSSLLDKVSGLKAAPTSLYHPSYPNSTSNIIDFSRGGRSYDF
jgi:hypothetical protein